MPAWYDSRFTGLFAGFDRVPPRPHDPDVEAWAGTVPGTTGRRRVSPLSRAGRNRLKNHIIFALSALLGRASATQT